MLICDFFPRRVSFFFVSRSFEFEPITRPRSAATGNSSDDSGDDPSGGTNLPSFCVLDGHKLIMTVIISYVKGQKEDVSRKRKLVMASDDPSTDAVARVLASLSARNALELSLEDSILRKSIRIKTCLAEFPFFSSYGDALGITYDFIGDNDDAPFAPSSSRKPTPLPPKARRRVPKPLTTVILCQYLHDAMIWLGLDATKIGFKSFRAGCASFALWKSAVANGGQPKETDILMTIRQGCWSANSTAVKTVYMNNIVDQTVPSNIASLDRRIENVLLELPNILRNTASPIALEAAFNDEMKRFDTLTRQAVAEANKIIAESDAMEIDSVGAASPPRNFAVPLSRDAPPPAPLVDAEFLIDTDFISRQCKMSQIHFVLGHLLKSRESAGSRSSHRQPTVPVVSDSTNSETADDDDEDDATGDDIIEDRVKRDREIEISLQPDTEIDIDDDADGDSREEPVRVAPPPPPAAIISKEDQSLFESTLETLFSEEDQHGKGLTLVLRNLVQQSDAYGLPGPELTEDTVSAQLSRLSNEHLRLLYNRVGATINTGAIIAQRIARQIAIERLIERGSVVDGRVGFDSPPDSSEFIDMLDAVQHVATLYDNLAKKNNFINMVRHDAAPALIVPDDLVARLIADAADNPIRAHHYGFEYLVAAEDQRHVYPGKVSTGVKEVFNFTAQVFNDLARLTRKHLKHVLKEIPLASDRKLESDNLWHVILTRARHLRDTEKDQSESESIVLKLGWSEEAIAQKLSTTGPSQRRKIWTQGLVERKNEKTLPDPDAPAPSPQVAGNDNTDQIQSMIYEETTQDDATRKIWKCKASDGTFACPVARCGEKFSSFIPFRRHCRRAHSGSKGKESPSSSPGDNDDSPGDGDGDDDDDNDSEKVKKTRRGSSVKNPVTCPRCHATFPSLKALYDHSVTHVRRWMCPERGCGKSYPLQRNFIDHYREDHLQSRFACGFDGCKVVAHSANSLAKHASAAHGNEAWFKDAQEKAGKKKRGHKRGRPSEADEDEDPAPPAKRVAVDGAQTLNRNERTAAINTWIESRQIDISSATVDDLATRGFLTRAKFASAPGGGSRSAEAATTTTSTEAASPQPSPIIPSSRSGTIIPTAQSSAQSSSTSSTAAPGVVARLRTVTTTIEFSHGDDQNGVLLFDSPLGVDVDMTQNKPMDMFEQVLLQHKDILRVLKRRNLVASDCSVYIGSVLASERMFSDYAQTESDQKVPLKTRVWVTSGAAGPT